MTYRPSRGAVIGGVSAVSAAIIAAIFAVEGDYSNNKNDPGGKTKYGVTEAVARKHGYEGDMKVLPKETAYKIYEKDYIEAPGFNLFLEVSPAVAEELVDSGVNVGPGRPSIWLQNSLNLLSKQGTSYPLIPVDGSVGPRTLEAYKNLERTRGKVTACQLVIKSLDGQQTQYYLDISKSNPKLQEFTAGWLTHRIGNVPLSRCG